MQLYHFKLDFINTLLCTHSNNENLSNKLYLSNITHKTQGIKNDNKMRDFGIQHYRSSSFLENSRRVPLNTIILPPISPPLPENSPELIGRVLVNKSKGNNVNNEQQLVSNAANVSARAQEVSSPERPKGPDSARVAQLEQNIRFLQEQHQLMLTGLHNEVETLRNRNRELQFQLVFVKGTLPSSPSSPEDDTKHKVYISPKPINITPLQIEILEKEMGELKFQLQEAESRNIYLSAIVDEQKKKLERYERDREKERERALQPDPELLRKLDDAETLIRRLRRENSDLRRETVAAAAAAAAAAAGGVPQHYQLRESGGNNPSYSKEARGGNHRGRHHRGNGSGGGGGNGHYRGNWFPPLHSQSYWQQGGNNSRQDRSNGGPADGSSTALPNLGGAAPATSTTQFHHHQSRRGSNNNHYHNNDGRKYRGQNKSTKPS